MSGALRFAAWQLGIRFQNWKQDVRGGRLWFLQNILHRSVGASVGIWALCNLAIFDPGNLKALDLCIKRISVDSFGLSGFLCIAKKKDRLTNYN